MSKLRYVVAMIRRDDPIKAGHPPRDHVRAEFPVEDLIGFISENLSLPEKKGFFKSKKYTKEEAEHEFSEALRAGVSRAYSWLINNRREEEKPVG